MRRAAPFLLAITLLFTAACISHEKAGDKAAAVGDWKVAERAYAEAVRKDPKKPELQEKYRQAKAAALSEAIRKAQACWAARDVECAFEESDYVLHLDAGNAEMAAMRASASREAGLLRVRRADEALGRGDPRAAMTFLLSAREASGDAAVTSAIASSSPRVVLAAVKEADRFRAQAQYPQAIDLLGLAVRLDPSVQPRLQSAEAEYERWKDGEAERLAREGDRLLDGGRYAEAEVSYRAALALRPRSRALPLASYASAMARGTAALERRDLPTAERAFTEAAQLNVDRGQAAAQLDRVRLRPYAVALRSVLVRPVRPDGSPWAGPRSRDLDRVANRFEDALRGGLERGTAFDLARRVPRANEPVLVITVALPDGRAAQTASHRGIYARLESSFTVLSNGFDDRTVSFRVVHDDGGGRMVDVGLVHVRLGDLVTNGKVTLAGSAVAALEVEAAFSDRPDGALDRLILIPAVN